MKSLVTLLLSFSFLQICHSQHSDCSAAFNISDYKLYEFSASPDSGMDEDEVDPNSCGFSFISEEPSTWLSFSTCTSGMIYFTITPADDVDMDFIVYRLDENKDCSTKSPIRCMFSGENQNMNSDNCTGPTGLDPDETDFSEAPGCDTLDNNFLAALECLPDEHYVILINDFSRTGDDFTIEFFGDVALKDVSTTDDIESKERVMCYPNPASEFIMVGEGSRSQLYKIYDTTGQTVLSGSSNRGRIETAHLENGIYIINTEGEYGSFVIHR